jgi:hypothetical protein
LRQRRIQGIQQLGHGPIVLVFIKILMGSWRKLTPSARKASKLPKMRAQQDATPAGCRLIQNALAAEDLDLEALQSPGQEIDSIQNGGGEAVNVAKQIPPARLAAQRPPQIAPGTTTAPPWRSPENTG